MMTRKPPEVPRPANIADPYWDLLLPLDEARRQGFIRRLAVGYYEDWRPTRQEVALLVDFELGRVSAEQLDGPLPVSFGPGLDPNRADDDTGGGDNLLEYPSDTIRAVRPPVETTDIGGNPRRAALATFSVDCGPLAPPFRFIAAGVSSEGWTFRVGQRYRRTFLHYRLVMPIRSLAPQGQSITPIFYNGAIICVPEIIAPGDPGDGRSRKHSVGPGMVIGSRGPWAVADGATWMKFLITAQSPPGDRQRRHPAGSLSVNLRTGAAAWTIAPGLSDAGSGRAASR